MSSLMLRIMRNQSIRPSMGDHQFMSGSNAANISTYTLHSYIAYISYGSAAKTNFVYYKIKWQQATASLLSYYLSIIFGRAYA